MKIRSLHDLALFVRIADCGSLSAAARQLDLSPAVASAALKRLEHELDCVLFIRSTRSLRLSPAGDRLLPAARQALDSLTAASDAIASGQDVLRDHLQIAMPSDLGRHLLLDLLNHFQELHPGVNFHLVLADQMTDLYRQPVDIAIRYGQPADSGLIALPLLPENRRILCAAPEYIARYGEPASPEELSHHNCLCFQLSHGTHDQWRFTRGSQTVQVAVRGDRSCNDADIARRWAIAGHGIVCKSQLDLSRDLAAGRLLPLCRDWQAEALPLYLVCADRRLLSPTVARLRNFLQQGCAAALDD